MLEHFFLVEDVAEAAWPLLGTLSKKPHQAVKKRRAAKIAAYVAERRAARCAPMFMADDRELTKVVFGRNMERARHLAGNMTQKQLAEQLGVDRREVNRWESGRHEPHKYRTRIAKILGQPIDFFYDASVLDEDPA